MKVSFRELGLVNTREMFAKAVKGGYAIPAFNFNNMEQLQAIIQASAETKSPVILQVSKGARNYANQTLLRYMAQGAVEYEEVYHDRFYGTLKSEVERIWQKGHVIVFDVDVKGGVNLKKYFGDAALSVLIVPPSMEVLEKRLRGRGTDSEEAIRERLDKAASELEFAAGKFDRDLVNDKLEETFAEAEALVDAFLCG